MGLEVLDKWMTPMAKAPSVTIQKRGVISLKKAAHQLIDSAQTVELLYDADRQVVALRPADAPTYAVRNGATRGPRQAIVSATAFTQHYNIDTTATRRWKPWCAPWGSGAGGQSESRGILWGQGMNTSITPRGSCSAAPTPLQG